MTTVKQLLLWGEQYLSQTSSSARLDAELLLCHVLSKPRSHLFTYPEKTVSEDAMTAYQFMIKRRNTGYPIAYLTGTKDFWSLSLTVNEHTLIPRPETELLVELSLQHIEKTANASVIDLGTGSGAIALAIASERPDVTITAVDNNLEAIKTAQLNQQKYQLSQVQFLCADWLCAIDSQHTVDLIVSNPPYIAETDPHLHTDIRHEPPSALVSGSSGIDDIQRIIQAASHHLKQNGWLLIEHGYDQPSCLHQLLSEHQYANIQCWQDLAGNPRVSGGQYRV